MKESRVIIEPHEVKDGFNFTVLWMNCPAMIEGILNQCELVYNRPFEWTDEKLSPHFKYANVTGKMYRARERVDAAKYRDASGKKKPYSAQLYWMRETQDCHGWDEMSRLLYKKQCEGMQMDIWETMNLGDPKLPSLDFYFARNGATVDHHTLIGRYLSAIDPFNKDNVDTMNIMHDHVLNMGIQMEIDKLKIKAFETISEWELDDLLANYNTNIVDKNSRPPFALEIEENYPMTNTEELAVYKYLKAIGVKELPQLWSWHFMLSFFAAPNIPTYMKEELWATIQNWYIRATETVKAIMAIQREMYMRSIGAWEDITLGVIQAPRELSCSMGQRSSISIMKAERYVDENGDYSVKFKGKENKTRLVIRGVDAGASLATHDPIKNAMKEYTNGRYVCDREGWLMSKLAWTGNDFKKSDYTCGRSYNLLGIGRITKSGKLYITGPPLNSGQDDTMEKNTGMREDVDRYCGTLKYKRFGQGDDAGYKKGITQKELITKCFLKLPMTFEFLTDKQTTDYDAEIIKRHGVQSAKWSRGERIVDIHEVFNLGTHCVYDGNENERFFGRSEKGTKTEQSPTGTQHGDTPWWRYTNESKARFSDIWPNERPLWYSRTLSEFFDFMRSITDWSVFTDLPGSLIPIIKRPRLPLEVPGL